MNHGTPTTSPPRSIPGDGAGHRPAQRAATRDDSAHSAASAWRSRAGWITVLTVAVLSIVVDLASKHLAFVHVADAPVVLTRADVLAMSSADPRLVTTLIPPHPPVIVVPDALHFTLVLNPGAVFGIGPGQRWFFVAFTVVALAFGLLMFARWTTAKDRFAHAAIGLLIGGGLGNLYDRLTYGCVRDFIHPLPGWRWPGGVTIGGNAEIWPYVSNVADLLLLIGIGMLLVHLWRKDRAAAARPGADTRPARTPA